jgi:beta-galactosidase
MKIPWKKAPQKLLHGADYNPEQWSPEVWKKDLQLMKRAGVNVVSIGIFSWSFLEPREGRYEFGWLDDVISLLEKNKVDFMLATPSGARPAWMAQKYPEVLRVNEQGIRNVFGRRHNHCLTSPVYRRKVGEINRKLAQRYGKKESLLLWHISNEYGGDCHCDLCQKAFRSWLRSEYQTLDQLNQGWWSSFWSHRYTDWSQIHSPGLRGDTNLHGLTLAWKRFVTEQTVDFYRTELAAIREFDQKTPATTNFMGFYEGLDYNRFAKEVDVVSWDSYPDWHSGEGSEVSVASGTAMAHDMNRSMKKGLPFLLMESTPSQVNWKPVNKLKRPGMHLLSSIQAIAHGSDSVQYFQWRKSRGSSEKFHGAVVDHRGDEETRVFREVVQVGEVLKKISGIRGGSTRTEVALVHDWENRWAIEGLEGWRKDRKNYIQQLSDYYGAFWSLSIPVDCIGEEADLSGYKLVVAPMLYMLRSGFAEKLEKFVAQGGTLLVTQGTGTVDRNDLVFEGGPPGPLRSVLGLWVEETDALHDFEDVKFRMISKTSGLKGVYKAVVLCERIHPETAETLALYQSEFYAGEACLTRNRHQKGEAYYLACRAEIPWIRDFISHLTKRLRLSSSWPLPLPEGVNVQKRFQGEKGYFFVMNFNPKSVVISLPKGKWRDEVSGETLTKRLPLSAYGVKILTDE